MEQQLVDSKIKENVEMMNRLLPVKESFDIVERNMLIGGRKSCLYFINGFTNDESEQKIIDFFYGIQEDGMPEDIYAFIEQCVPYTEVEVINDYHVVLKNLFSGVSCLFIDGYQGCIAIDCRTYQARSVEEPEKDKSLRGSRDGFVETIVFNIL